MEELNKIHEEYKYSLKNLYEVLDRLEKHQEELKNKMESISKGLKEIIYGRI